jgi:hypothetical protein
VLIAKMQTVVDDLKQAEAPDLPAIIEGLDLETAQTAWNQLVSFAQGMQASAENIPVNVVTPPKVPRAA